MPISLAVLVTTTLFAAAPAPSPGPTLAVEDTMHTSVPEVLVRAPRVTLDEILDRVGRGEARRESLMTDQSLTATLRVVRNVMGKKAPELFLESVYRVYRKRPDRLRTVLLRQWQADQKEKDKGKDDVDVDFSPGMGEQVVNFAFRPGARRDFKYHIAGRDLVGNHLIYRIAFEPRSLLDPTAPSGLVWVDTNEFVIVREEVEFRQSPIPLFLRGIHRMIVERQQVDGAWVLRRVLLRAELTIPFPKFGKSFDMAILYDDYAINSGLPDSLFAKTGGRR